MSAGAKIGTAGGVSLDTPALRGNEPAGAAIQLGEPYVGLVKIDSRTAPSATSDIGLELYRSITSTPGYVILSIPFRRTGYVANAGAFCSNEIYCYTGLVNSGTLRNENIGIYLLNNNAIVGTMGGTPETGNGTFNSTYTNPHNVTTNLRMYFDPAKVPSRGPDVTYQGLSLECAPQRPVADDSAPSRAAKKRGALCAYVGMDTGTGGAPGTAYGSELLNLVQNVSTNSGTSVEINTNFNGRVQDGGFTRSLFITGGGNYTNHNSSAIEINHGCYATACADNGGGYYGNGIVIRGSVNHIVLQRGKAGEKGYFLEGISEANRLIFSVDKNASLKAASAEAATVKGATSVQSGPHAFAFYTACNGAAEGTQVAVTDSAVDSWGAVVSGGGSNHVLAYCNGTNWTVMAK